MKTIKTNKSDYAPGETATITTDGFAIGSTVELSVQHITDAGADGILGTPDDILGDNSGAGHEPWYVTDGGTGDLDGIANGSIQTEWYVNPDDSLGASFLATAQQVEAGIDGAFGTADDLSAGEPATMSFTDSQLAVWAWRNTGGTANTWNAGTTIQQANSIYAEGEVIPFRWTSIAGGGAAPNLVENQTYTIQLDYAYAGGIDDPQKLFFDYLTSYNATETTTNPFGSGSDLAGFQTGLLSTVAIPNDTGDTGGIPPNPSTIPHPAWVFTLFNMTSVTFGSYTADPVNNNQEDRRLNITFTVADDGDSNHAENMNVGIAWGAHLATQANYGLQNGAANFPGASPQMVVDFDPFTTGGLSNLNINPNAIVPQGQITIIKDAQPNSPQDFGFTITGPTGANITPTFTLDDDDADPTLPNQITFFGLAEGVYTITENSVSGWSLVDITRTETGAEDTTAGDIFTGNVGARTATITVANGEVWTTTFTNQQPGLAIDKTFSYADNDKSGDVSVGDVISYGYQVTNTGTANLTDVSVLAPGEVENGTATYTVKADDLGKTITNVATTDSQQTALVTDTENVAVPMPNYTISKTVISIINPDGTNGGVTVDQIGDIINYSIVVKNTGTANLTGVVVKDQVESYTQHTLTLDSGDTNHNGILDAALGSSTAETWVYKDSYRVIAQDFTNNGGGDGDIDNTATSTVTQISTPKTDSAHVGINNTYVGQVAPTGTTVGQYLNGTSSNLEDAQYSILNPGKIQTNPGVFFYFTGRSGDLVADSKGHLSIDIVQSNDNANFSLFDVVKNNVQLYTVNAGADHIIGTNDDTATSSKLGTITVIDSGDNGNGSDQVSIVIADKAAAGQIFAVSVKYDTSVVTAVSPAGSAHYNFSTNANGFLVEQDNPNSSGVSGVDLNPKKAALMLDGDATHDGHAPVLQTADLQHVVDQAINFWAQHGADSIDLSMLRETQVKIADLGGTQLGLTDAANVVTIDDDAAGYGWFTGHGEVNLQMVDLLSAVTHEFGHVLGYEHDVMDATLAVGERDLPAINDWSDAAANAPVELVGVLPHQLVSFA
jgi:uncharacterized repeat protein (TIGR01451 family)